MVYPNYPDFDDTDNDTDDLNFTVIVNGSGFSVNSSGAILPDNTTNTTNGSLADAPEIVIIKGCEKLKDLAEKHADDTEQVLQRAEEAVKCAQSREAEALNAATDVRKQLACAKDVERAAEAELVAVETAPCYRYAKRARALMNSLKKKEAAAEKRKELAEQANEAAKGKADDSIEQAKAMLSKAKDLTAQLAALKAKLAGALRKAAKADRKLCKARKAKEAECRKCDKVEDKCRKAEPKCAALAKPCENLVAQVAQKQEKERAAKKKEDDLRHKLEDDLAQAKASAKKQSIAEKLLKMLRAHAREADALRGLEEQALR